MTAIEGEATGNDGLPYPKGERDRAAIPFGDSRARRLTTYTRMPKWAHALVPAG